MILAIIALIATPIVLNIISESKESANLRSAEMYIGAVETSIATSTLNNQKVSNGTTISETTACNGEICYGHAISETARWYEDYFYLVLPTRPWFTCGGDYKSGIETGMFVVGNLGGLAIGSHSTRITLTPTTY